MKAGVVLVTVVLVLSKASALQWTFEGELTRGSHQVNRRLAASQQEVAHISQGESLIFQICLMKETNVTFRDIVFSNDGGPDRVVVTFDNIVVGEFNTASGTDFGRLWNVFRYTGTLGSIMAGSGIHRLVLRAETADFWGVEIDRVVMEIDDEHLNSDIYLCKYPCSQDVLPLTGPPAGSVPEGYISQQSYPTACAEEDNVVIPVFHNSVSEYVVAAKLPAYHSFKNERAPNFDNCSFASDVYWNFTNIDVASLSRTAQQSVQATLDLKAKTVNPDGTKTLQIGTAFSVVNLADPQIGGNIHLTLSGIGGAASVTLLYKGGSANGYTQLNTFRFSTDNPSYVWSIPDFTWTQTSNDLLLFLVSNQSDVVNIDEFYLQTRETKGDTFVTIYKGDVVVNGVTKDLWWRTNETMEVSLTTSTTTWTTHYIQVYVPIPWSGGWCQVMVLYEDGNVRLLPTTPDGTDWIPFGSSIVVGQSNIEARPSAPITKLKIDPAALTFDVVYADGGTATMTLLPLVERTELRLSNINMTRNTTAYPFATFRSMYIEGANADCDTVASNTQSPEHIMDSWGTISGALFGFLRRCHSRHLTQSPDLYLGIMQG
ncbi:uncharacterized protein LOC124112956 [Haliotis rufescens]|uniref:uncharacterized protein LOC124112956 n=1 Tax=Haliotis rufescens TaxID=6454 RepID=UPI00201EC2D6|nr:uncharacterized protein LOC124112956 [Haliotis rufescens]